MIETEGRGPAVTYSIVIFWVLTYLTDVHPGIPTRISKENIKILSSHLATIGICYTAVLGAKKFIEVTLYPWFLSGCPEV